MESGDWKKLVAELIGTFIFFFVGAGTIISTEFSKDGLVAIAFAHGLALAVMVSIFGRISGGHFNPAVTAGIWVGQRISSSLAITYVVAQLVGGSLAGFALLAIFDRRTWGPSNLGTPDLANGISFSTGVVVEIILTFALVLAVYGTAVSPSAPRIGGLGIGLTVCFDILMGGPLTGASMNPARTFGTAIASGHWDNHLVYWIGPIIGGVLASLLWNYVMRPEEMPEPAGG